MDCREAQSLIVPFIKSELTMEQAKAFFQHIDFCEDCKEELEVYYILLIGLKELDEDPSDSLDLHGQFEEHLSKARERVEKRNWERFPKLIILLSLIGILLVMITKQQEHIAKQQEAEQKMETLFEILPEYDPFMNKELIEKKAQESNFMIKYREAIKSEQEKKATKKYKSERLNRDNNVTDYR